MIHQILKNICPSKLHVFKKTGMTLVELIIATTILLIVFSIIMSTFSNFTSSKRKLLLDNELHNETVFLLERIAREIHNGTIDYQGYWRENLLNKTADYWVSEGINPSGVTSSGDMTSISTPGFNAMKNCNDPDSLSDSSDDTDTEEKQKNILFNYRFQFIYPGSQRLTIPEETGNDYYPTLQNVVHLNCVKDNHNAAKYNIYDDEPAYGNGPRAFSEDTNTQTPLFDFSSSTNSSQGSKMFWDWNLQDNGGTPNPIVNNNPPLFLIKKFSSPDNGVTHERTALRLENKKIKLIRFKGKDTDNAPPDFIPDEWKCESDFGCGNTKTYDGSYIWSQKETAKDLGGDVSKGEDNGIGTITDTDLEWKDITPEKIEITSFDFILSPVKDSHRAFYEKTKIQKPQITLILEAQAKVSAMKGIKGNPPKIRIQTTVTPRIWDLVEDDN